MVISWHKAYSSTDDLIYLHAKFRASSSKIDWVIDICAVWTKWLEKEEKEKEEEEMHNSNEHTYTQGISFLYLYIMVIVSVFATDSISYMYHTLHFLINTKW